jgi:hypothetical protein
MIYKKGCGIYATKQKRRSEQEMGVVRRKKRGPKKIEALSSLQAVEFDIDAIKEIKRRKRRLCKTGSNRKS